VRSNLFLVVGDCSSAGATLSLFVTPAIACFRSRVRGFPTSATNFFSLFLFLCSHTPLLPVPLAEPGMSGCGLVRAKLPVRLCISLLDAIAHLCLCVCFPLLVFLCPSIFFFFFVFVLLGVFCVSVGVRSLLHLKKQKTRSISCGHLLVRRVLSYWGFLLFFFFLI
jgi:hypothetical protein